MNVTDLRPHIGRFGLIQAGEVGNKKTLHGTLADMDTRGTVWFKDNDGYGYAFKANQIDLFQVKDYEPAPTQHNGQDVYFNGGRWYYKATNKECKLDK